LSLLSPVVAVLVGWLALHQTLSLAQTAGILVVLASVWIGQRSQRAVAPAVQTAQPTASKA
jgi:probable blue pigment (indigoidine) exporter